MDLWQLFTKFFLHLDTTLVDFVRDYGVWTYLILFVVVFCETGLVFTPFLPGDTLIFAAGAIAAGGGLNLAWLFVLLCAAAIIGDTANYWIGKYLGAQILRRHSRWVKPEHIDRTHAFFEKYGGKTIIIARFVPIIRTFAPFVAGLGAMTYRKFIAYNVIGGLLWVVVCLGAGFAFGRQEFVQKHFSLVILAIVAISVMPAGWGYVNARAQARRERATAEAQQTPRTQSGSEK
jgi:membrane-associated protein